MILHLVYKYLNRLRFHKVNSNQYWNKMRILCDIKVLIVNIYVQIIVLFMFINNPIFANQHINNDSETHSMLASNDLDPQSENERDTKTKQNQDNKKMILFDDNLYLLDDDFDFGNNVLDLQKIEIDPDDLEIAKEYEDCSYR